MNLNAIKKACVARRRAMIMNAPDGGQWISSGQCCYPVEGMRMSLEALEALFNLSEKQRENMAFLCGPADDPRLCATEADGEEWAREAGKLVFMDAVFIALATPRGVMYIPNDPIKHIRDDYRRYAVRWRGGEPMVAVYGNLFVEALCLPLGNAEAAAANRTAAEMAGARYTWPENGTGGAEEAAEAMAEAMGA